MHRSNVGSTNMRPGIFCVP